MPVRQSIVKAKLARNETSAVVTCHLTDPAVHELIGRMGFDCIWMDMEHHVYSLERAQDCVRAAQLGPGSDVMMRPGKGEFMRMARMLETGAQGILYPRCDDAAEAAEVVRWAKFPPLGERGCDAGNRDNPFCTVDTAQYIKDANEQTFIAIQVEQQKAVDQAEAIGAVDGVDIIFFGPGDFSVLEGVPGQVNSPKHQKAVEKVAAAARNTGKHWGMPSFSFDHAEQLMQMGARLLSFGADIMLLRKGLFEIEKQLKQRGLPLRNSLTGDSETTTNA